MEVIIIPITQLNKFLMAQGVILPEQKANVTTSSFCFNKEKWETRIRELYACDYCLKPEK